MIRPDLKKLSQFATTCCYKNLTSRILTSSRCGNYYGKEDAFAGAPSNVSGGINPMRIQQRVALCQLGRNDIHCCTNCTKVNDSIWNASKKSAFWVPDNATSWFERERELRRQRHQSLLEQCKLFGITSATTTTVTTSKLKVVQPIRDMPLTKQRIDPKKFKRISPEFLKLLQQYDDSMMKQCPAYGLPPDMIKSPKKRRITVCPKYSSQSANQSSSRPICKCAKSTDTITIQSGPTWYDRPYADRPHAHGFGYYDQPEKWCECGNSSKASKKCVTVKTTMLTDNESNDAKKKAPNDKKMICPCAPDESQKLAESGKKICPCAPGEGKGIKTESSQDSKSNAQGKGINDDLSPTSSSQRRKDDLTSPTSSSQRKKEDLASPTSSSQRRKDELASSTSSQRRKDDLDSCYSSQYRRKDDLDSSYASQCGRKDDVFPINEATQSGADICGRTETIEIYRPKKFFSCFSPSQRDSVSDICDVSNNSPQTCSEKSASFCKEYDACEMKQKDSCEDQRHRGGGEKPEVHGYQQYPRCDQSENRRSTRDRDTNQKPVVHGYRQYPTATNLPQRLKKPPQKYMFEYKLIARKRSPPKFSPENQTVYKPRVQGYQREIPNENRKPKREVSDVNAISLQPHAHGYHEMPESTQSPARSATSTLRKSSLHAHGYAASSNLDGRSPQTTKGKSVFFGSRPKAHAYQREQGGGVSPKYCPSLLKTEDYNGLSSEPHAHGYVEMVKAEETKRSHETRSSKKKDKRDSSRDSTPTGSGKAAQPRSSESKEDNSNSSNAQKRCTDKEIQCTPSIMDRNSTRSSKHEHCKKETFKRSGKENRPGKSDKYRYGGSAQATANKSRRRHLRDGLSESKSDVSVSSSRFASGELETSATCCNCPHKLKRSNSCHRSKKPKVGHKGALDGSASKSSLEMKSSESRLASRSPSRSRSRSPSDRFKSGLRITEVNSCRHKQCYKDSVDWRGVSKAYPVRYQRAAKDATVDKETLRKHRARNTSSSKINIKKCQSPHTSRSTSRHRMCRKDSTDWRGVSKNYPVRYQKSAKESKQDNAILKEHKAGNTTSSRYNDKTPHTTKSRHDMCGKDSSDWRGVSKNYPARYQKSAREMARNDAMLERHKETVYRKENVQPLYHRGDRKSNDQTNDQTNDRHKSCRSDSVDWSHATKENYPNRYRAAAAEQAKEAKNLAAARAKYPDVGRRYVEYEPRQRVPLATVYGPVQLRAHGYRAQLTPGKENNLKVKALGDRYVNYGPDYILGKPRSERFAYIQAK